MNEHLISEIRKDPVVGRWVIIMKDKGYFPTITEHIKRDSNEKCAFCAGNEHQTPTEIMSIRNSKDEWDVRVFPNKYPALNIEDKIERFGIGIFDKMRGFGAHEVIVETPMHGNSITDMDTDQMVTLLNVFRSRIIDLKKDNRFKYVLVFKNEGFLAGASIDHSHSQLIATPIIPKRVVEELNGSAFYWDYKRRCIFCDIIAHEKKFFPERIVFENDLSMVISPFASRFPFEMWIMPKDHIQNFENTPNATLNDIAVSLLNALRSLNKILENPHYNVIIHNSPIGQEKTDHYHWHIEIIPKVKKTAGFEWGTGFYINPLGPEEAAEYLKRGLNK